MRLLILSLIFLETLTFAAPNLKSTFIAQVPDSIFEVVVPLKWDIPKYDKKLDEVDIPIHLRNAKYTPIGSAFFVTTKRLVSSAHAVNILSRKNDSGPYYIRDKEGNVHEIKNIYKYSNKANLVVFDLKTYPDSVVPIKISTKFQLGMEVCALGNAIGQGIAIRCGGQIASTTPELFSGRWKNIRYTAPSSPGNSGGPLLNIRGIAIGIVTQKGPNENLNTAIPMKILKKTKGISIEQRSFSIREPTGLETKAPYLKKASSPTALADLWAKTRDEFEQHQIKALQKHHKKYKYQRFPHNKNIMTSVKNGLELNELAATIRTNDFKKWYYQSNKVKSLHITGDRYILVHPDILPNSTTLTIDGKPNESPQKLLSLVLSKFPITNRFGRNTYRVKSHGKPTKKETIWDNMGRHWTISQWDVALLSLRRELICTPIPRGNFCIFRDHSYHSTEKFQSMTLIHNLDEIQIAYSGKLKHWRYYKRIKNMPKFLVNNFDTPRKGKTLTIKIMNSNQTLKLDSDNSWINIYPNYVYTKNNMKISIFSVSGIKDPLRNDTSVKYTTFYRPTTSATTSLKRSYQDAMKKKRYYDGKPYSVDGSFIMQKNVFQTKKYIVLKECRALNKKLLKKLCK